MGHLGGPPVSTVPQSLLKKDLDISAKACPSGGIFYLFCFFAWRTSWAIVDVIGPIISTKASLVATSLLCLSPGENGERFWQS